MTDTPDPHRELARKIINVIDDELNNDQVEHFVDKVTGMLTDHILKEFFDAGMQETQYFKSLKKASVLREKRNDSE